MNPTYVRSAVSRMVAIAMAIAVAVLAFAGDNAVTASASLLTLPACSIAAVAPVTSATTQPRLRQIAETRHYPKQGITFTASNTADGAIQVDARGGEFGFRKKVFQDGRFVAELSANGDMVTIANSVDGPTITRGAKTLTLSPQAREEELNAVARLLADSRAVRLLRAKGAAFEASEEDSAAAASLLLVDSLVGALTGDIGAPHRVGALITKKARAQMRTVQGRPNTCYYQWEQTCLWAFMDYEECAFLYWYPQIMCSTRWFLQVESAWFGFLSCSAQGLF